MKFFNLFILLTLAFSSIQGLQAGICECTARYQHPEVTYMPLLKETVKLLGNASRDECASKCKDYSTFQDTKGAGGAGKMTNFYEGVYDHATKGEL